MHHGLQNHFLKSAAQTTLTSFTSFPHEETSSKKFLLSLVDLGLGKVSIQLKSKTSFFSFRRGAAMGGRCSPPTKLNLVLCRALFIQKMHTGYACWCTALKSLLLLARLVCIFITKLVSHQPVLTRHFTQTRNFCHVGKWWST